MTVTEAPRLREPEAKTIAGLRAALLRAEYTQERVAEALGPRSPLPRIRREVQLRRLEDAGNVGTLIRLFRLADTVSPEAAEAALAPADPDALVEAGLLESRADGIASAVELTSSLGLLLIHDRGDSDASMVPWQVNLGSASRTLAALTVRRPVERTLDLGTGCGVQALLAARHSGHVVATDVNDRALTFARINAALNEVSNVEFRPGNLFDPVEGERFGLVVSNPPFVVSPDAELMFRDSELPGDEISRRVVHDAAAHLDDGGHATILCSWIAPPNDHWSTPLRGWVAEGCDALLLQFTSARPLAYAAMWTHTLDPWLDYYRREGIEWISTGAAILRRREPGGRIVAYQANSAPRTNASDQLVRVLDAEPLDDEALLGARFRLVDHRLRQEAAFRDGRYTIELTGVEIGGAPLNVRVEPEVVHLLARLDGSSTVAGIVGDSPLRKAMLTTVRRLYERGFLVSAPRP